MKLQVRHFVFLILIASLLTSTYFLFERYRLVTDYPAANLKGDPNHPASASNWVDTRLYFGLGPANVPSKGVSDQAWRDFLDKEVTPRFPSGLSVLDVYGQWQGTSETEPERVRTKLLIIDYPSTPDNEARIEAIRAAWKKRTGDKSVLKVTEGVNVSF
jgi:Protein of unknown function (DUF3574)